MRRQPDLTVVCATPDRYANATVLPADAVLSAVKLHGLLTLHFVAPPKHVQWEHLPLFLRNMTDQLLEREQQQQQQFQQQPRSSLSTAVPSEPAAVARRRMVRQVLVSKLHDMFAAASFPREFLAALRRRELSGGGSGGGGWGGSRASPRHSTLSGAAPTGLSMVASQQATHQLIGVLFALLEGSTERVTNPSDRIEMSPIRFPEVLDVIARAAPALDDAHFEQVLTRIDILCKLPASASTIVNAGGPWNRQWWQGWLSVMLLEAVTRRQRTYVCVCAGFGLNQRDDITIVITLNLPSSTSVADARMLDRADCTHP